MGFLTRYLAIQFYSVIRKPDSSRDLAFYFRTGSSNVVERLLLFICRVLVDYPKVVE